MKGETGVAQNAQRQTSRTELCNSIDVCGLIGIAFVEKKGPLEGNKERQCMILKGN